MKIKMELKKFINLSMIIDLNNYKQSLNKWFQFRKQYENINQNIILTAFSEYLDIVKPIIHHFSQLTNKLSPQQYGFYTDLNIKDINKVKELYDPLKKFDIINIYSNLEKEQLKIDKSDQIATDIFEQPKQILNRLDLTKNPSNLQYQWWGHSMSVREVIVKSKIIRGKGVGAKQLGMPTANLFVTQQLNKQLLEFPNGIYIVTFQLEEREKYTAVASLGTNPHYENFINSRCVQAYILHDFGDKKFYDNTVTVTFHRLIRLEGKFTTFDCFLNAMHNDIYVGKSFTN